MTQKEDGLYELALFAGAGGGLLGSKLLGWRTVCYVEREQFPVEIIKQRIADGILDDAPIWDDVTTFDGRPWAGLVDVISAGFPCQPYSESGIKRGQSDERNMWPDTRRIISEVRPRYCLLENVPGLLYFEYYGEILADLSRMGYCVRYGVISAATVGAPQLRKRLFILADSDKNRRVQNEIQPRKLYTTQYNAWKTRGSRLASLSDSETFFWAPDPRVCRVANGLAGRLDRYEAIGNGQVPSVVRAAWELLGGEL